jgi:hypothetical protein
LEATILNFRRHFVFSENIYPWNMPYSISIQTPIIKRKNVQNFRSS